MKQGLIWRILLTVFVLGLSVYVLLPAILPPVPLGPDGQPQPTGIHRYLPNTRINLGLDLMGGIQLTLGVEVDKAIQSTLNQMGQEMMAEANSQGFLMTSPALGPDDRLDFILTLPNKRAEFTAFLERHYPQLAYEEPKELPNGRLRYSLALKSSKRGELEEAVLEQALKTIRNRIDQFGVAEPDVRKQQDGRISVQLPGMDNTQRAIAIIGKTAHLEFRFVRDDVAMNRPAPMGVEFLPMQTRQGENATPEMLPVEALVAMTGEHITNASVQFDEKGQPNVSLSFDKQGSRAFSRITGENLKRRLAIVLDGKVHSAPVIQSQIEDTASITGHFTLEEATDLALVLRAGSLPAPVTVLEERTVGPSLGQESIDMGVRAAVIGGLAVMVFMAVYYGMSGLIANVMLALDIVLILAGMAMFGATLTMPGIAGIVLTLGMAVDANVLIFERIREELAAGATVLAAIEIGFSKATLAIVDSNLTTIIAAVILYEFGTGPIRGFAVTLTLGILVSMFTAIFVSRIIFTLWMSKPGRRLSI